MMDCSTDRLKFADDIDRPWFHRFGNGTTLYCNGSYAMDWVCNATIKADADIAGPGVISSFILVAWVTMFVAMFLAFFDLLAFFGTAESWSWHFSMTNSENSRVNSLRRRAELRRMLNLDRAASLRETAADLLGYLCDLQIVTGLAIVIAGMAQIQTISFYHESLAINYWWLTLNSFWAARIEYMSDEEVKYTRRATVRRIGVVVSIILAMVFQSIINIREKQDWFFLRSGYCYFSHDDTESWPWVAGASLYAICLLLNIVPASRPWVQRYHWGVRRMQGHLVKRWKKSVSALHASYVQPVNWSDVFDLRSLLHTVYRVASFGLTSLCLIFYWLLVQFMAVWSFGDGFYPLLTLGYIGFAIWTTFDILDLKLSNRSLIDGQETSWGFGQILPMVLLITIAYNALDALQGKQFLPQSTLIW